MTRKDELIFRLRQMAGGSPSELAAALNVEASDKTFRRAIAELVDEGALVSEGSTRDRTYRNPNAPVDLDRELLKILPCRARAFSDRCHELGLKGTAVQELKSRLRIQTERSERGFYFCWLPESSGVAYHDPRDAFPQGDKVIHVGRI
jgi:hypothetical protein